ncbi:hypothetical protein [Fusibacter sp. 3D3]|uniref:hypothetical protein n=1 Tax=Fusibacter sp. 3D3 TaxID=1048380 RepID=UPI00085372ED|nr:hypothetical protein [Fusibacter sp. 3D3]GAU79794.1 hypothetical protein F3D3_4459 [Fusibacter sp. 3D3]
MDKSDSQEDYQDDHQDDHQEDYQILKALFFTLSIVFMLDCYAIAQHYFNLYNLIYMLIVYPVMLFVVLGLNKSVNDLANDTERSIKLEKRFFVFLSLIMAFVTSSGAFLEYSMISLLSGLIHYSMHYLVKFCVFYAMMRLASKSYKKKDPNAHH